MIRTMMAWLADLAWSSQRREARVAGSSPRIDGAVWTDARKLEPLVERRTFRERHRSPSGNLRILFGWDGVPVDEDG